MKPETPSTTFPSTSNPARPDRSQLLGVADRMAADNRVPRKKRAEVKRYARILRKLDARKKASAIE